MYAEGTMEQTAVQLMSRKQRAAKLLTGDIGLTGLDALTEGEGGFEEALMDTIGRDDALLDPSQMFKSAAAVSDIYAEDAAYWNVEATEQDTEIEVREPADAAQIATFEAEPIFTEQRSTPLTADAYLETVHLIANPIIWRRLKRELLARVESGTADADISGWLAENRIVFPGCEAEVAAKLAQLVTVKGAEPVVAPTEIRSTTPRPKQKIIAFPQPETVTDGTPAKQLALF